MHNRIKYNTVICNKVLNSYTIYSRFVLYFTIQYLAILFCLPFYTNVNLLDNVLILSMLLMIMYVQYTLILRTSVFIGY